MTHTAIAESAVSAGQPYNWSTDNTDQSPGCHKACHRRIKPRHVGGYHGAVCWSWADTSDSCDCACGPAGHSTVPDVSHARGTSCLMRNSECSNCSTISCAISESYSICALDADTLLSLSTLYSFLFIFYCVSSCASTVLVVVILSVRHTRAL